MKKLLIGINSWNEREAKYLTQVLDSYASFTNYSVTIALACNYPYTYSGSLNIIPLTTELKGLYHTWSTHPFLADHYRDYDLIGNQDSDILLTEANVQYYFKHSEHLPPEYIIGFLPYEINASGQKTLISLWPFHHPKLFTKSTIDGYYIPQNKNSCCFMADKERFKWAIENGMSLTPVAIPPMDLPTTGRSGIYTQLTKVINTDNAEGFLVRHLPQKYSVHPVIGKLYPKLEELNGFIQRVS